MDSLTGRVLKAKDVKVEGVMRLDIGHPLGNTGKSERASAGSPQVLIVENNADFAVLEITCNCGTKSRVQCEYTK